MKTNRVKFLRSQVAYLRGIFDDSTNAFKHVHIGTVPVVLLDKDSSNAGVVSMLKWLTEGAGDAIDKGFLRQLVLEVYRSAGVQTPSNLVECYEFNISYPEPGMAALEIRQSCNMQVGK
jgi:hypothetical protein